MKEAFIVLAFAMIGGTFATIAIDNYRKDTPTCELPAMTEEDQRLLAVMEANITYGQGLRRLLARHRLYRRGENEHITPEEMEEFTRAAIKLYETGE